MSAPDIYMVCYDIRDDTRLRKVYKTVRGFGEALQYSVFRCSLSELQLAQLRDALVGTVEPTVDQVLFVRLGAANAVRTWQVSTVGVPIPDFKTVVHIF